MLSDAGPEGVMRNSLRSQVDIRPLDYRRLLGLNLAFSVSQPLSKKKKKKKVRTLDKVVSELRKRPEQVGPSRNFLILPHRKQTLI